ncbi:MAG: phospholipid carrier-dependent glycosyltransferase, partial [Nitrosopumilaceae archaeon]|nr:glycosyltransferase family 39 protein [Nitrosopumilaceae archaeon]NIU86626.1 phospholipid carrier-dependent glycosyltransferase [Nitrosopumilaceae archaeon]NIV65325.1 phospholipid carrier-dependent glycosyltransferase [Nitrosopumilaceae archaeon]NIX60816.1 phospholipid carrier-dependent glycosyltransferase [Nitrosopumilaceae archaeon]
GMLTLLVFFKIISRLTSEKNAILATAILSFDTIFFVHSSLFLRDIPVMFFGLFSFYMYQRKSYYFAAVVLGFSLLIKETAVFFLILITIYRIG